MLLVPAMASNSDTPWAAPGSDHAHAQFQRAIKRVKRHCRLYQENWSFDSLYSDFPGANGIDNASPESLNQVDRLSVPYSSQLGANNFIRISSAAPQLSTPPQRINKNVSPAVIDTRFL